MNAKPKYPPDASGGYNNQLQQSIYLWLPRYAWTIYYRSRSNQRLGSKLAPIRQSTTYRNAFMLKRFRPCLSVCPGSCKMVIHAHFPQLKYGLHVFDIVQPYQSDLVDLYEDLKLFPFLYSFCMVELWFECFEYYPHIQMWQYMLMYGVGPKPVAHLMKYHLLQCEVAKVKPLMNSNMTLTVYKRDIREIT